MGGNAAKFEQKNPCNIANKFLRLEVVEKAGVSIKGKCE